MRWFKDNRLSAIGLGLLGLVTVVLVVLALRPVDAPASNATPYTPPATNSPTAPEDVSEEPSETELPTEDPTEEASEEPEEPAQPVPTTRLLAAASEERAWRASVGSCEEAGTLEVTSDGGESWDAVDPRLAPIVRLKALDTETMFAIGGGEDCAASFQITGSAGSDWQGADEELGGSWYVEPSDRNTMHGPGGEAAPCETDLVDFAGLTNTVGMVLCTDGNLQATENAGASWSSVATAEGGVAIAPQLDADAEAQSYLLASLEADCEGVALRLIGSSGGGVREEPTACVEVSEAKPGEVAISLNGATVWLWAGDEVRVSSDAANSW